MTTSPQKEWIHDFFGGSRDFYGNVYGAMGVLDKKDTEKEVDGILKILNPEPGSHILDWCGGWGRHAIILAKRGFKVTLLDFSKDYLEVADNRARKEGLQLNLVHSDFRDTPPEIQADYAVNLFTAGLGYLGEENDLIALNSLRAALKPGARVLIDTMSLVWILRNFRPSSWEISDDGKWWRLDRRRFDFTTNTIHGHSVFCDEIKQGKFPEEMSCDHSLRVYSPAELARILKLAGFIPGEFFGDFNGQEFSLDSRRIVMIALREPD